MTTKEKGTRDQHEKVVGLGHKILKVMGNVYTVGKQTFPPIQFIPRFPDSSHFMHYIIHKDTSSPSRQCMED